MPRSSVAASLAVAVAACGGVTQPPDNPDAASAQADATPGLPDGGGTGAPSVVSFAPADGSTGVAADAVIVIGFSEPMDAASVEAAWTSADLPATDVTFAWSPAGDMLTVTPNTPLSLATGDGLDPSVVPALEYTAGIAATATDASGVALASPITSHFATKKLMSVNLAKLGGLSVTMRGDGLVLGEGGVNRAIGDTSANLQYKTFASFTVPAFPSSASIVAARFVAHQASPNGGPYALGPVTVQHVNTATIDAAAFGMAPLATIGPLSTDPDLEDKQLDVTAAFTDDVANHVARGDRTQYRLECPTATDNDGVNDYANFSRDSFALTVTYLAD